MASFSLENGRGAPCFRLEEAMGRDFDSGMGSGKSPIFVTYALGESSACDSVIFNVSVGSYFQTLPLCQ